MVVGGVSGCLLGSAVGVLMSIVMSADGLSTWGWRIPFLLGVVVGVFGLWLRRRLPEPPLAGRGPGRERLPILNGD
jgi:MFS transporter, MHS family, proline/betaine transporter